MGFLGGCSINGTFVFLTGSSLNPTQNINAPDMVQGNLIKQGWNYEKVEVGGNIAGPFSEDSASFLAKWSINRAAAPNGDQMANYYPVEIWYYNGSHVTYAGCGVNTFEISVTAGEVANYTIDMYGSTSPGAVGDSTVFTKTNITPQKLITWDQCTYSGIANIDLQSYTMTINNHLQRVYRLATVAEADKLYPFALAAGPRDISGSITAYADHGAPMQQFAPGSGFGAEQWTDYTATTFGATISMTIGSVFSISGLTSVFTRPTAQAKTDLALYTLNYNVLATQGTLDDETAIV